MNGKNRYFFAVYTRSKVTVKNGNRLRHSGKTFFPFPSRSVPFRYRFFLPVTKNRPMLLEVLDPVKG